MHHTDRNIHRTGFTCGSPARLSKPAKRFDALSFLVWTVGITSIVAIVLHYIGA